MQKCPICKGKMLWVEHTLVCPKCNNFLLRVLNWQKRLINEHTK
jgi:uncharacterized protein YbaR (Trm112 family)